MINPLTPTHRSKKSILLAHVPCEILTAIPDAQLCPHGPSTDDPAKPPGHLGQDQDAAAALKQQVDGALGDGLDGQGGEQEAGGVLDAVGHGGIGPAGAYAEGADGGRVVQRAQLDR